MFRFRDWRIYNEARALRLDAHKNLIPKIPEKEKYSLTSQIQRAIDSVILNIAEGSYRKTDKDLAHFLNQSLASLYEFVAALDLLLDSKYIKEAEHRDFCEKSENLARQISAFSTFLRKQ
jgi:four helix bundle protein